MRKTIYALAMALTLTASTVPTMAEETSTEAEVLAGDETTVEGIEALIQQLEKQISDLKLKLKELRGDQTIKEGDVIYSDDSVIITFDGVKEPKYNGYQFGFTTENLTDETIVMLADESSINGFMVDFTGYGEVAPNKKAKWTVELSAEDAEEYPEDELEEIETKFKICADNYIEKYSTDAITMYFK